MAAIVVVLSCSCFPHSGIAEERPPANQQALNAAFFLLYGRYTVIAFIGECAIVDAKTAEQYQAVLSQYSAENKPLLDRLDTIVQQEGIRSGKSPTYYQTDLQKSKETVKGLVEQRWAADKEKFLTGCRALPTEAAQHSGVLRPAAQEYPNAMRIIDEWR